MASAGCVLPPILSRPIFQCRYSLFQRLCHWY